ncbi:hypothetical protein LTR17_006146 [Elasticomyces elasticus]|nr:hypothetical protein LTR17_006146 [Elasticomyces elasticus]
MMLSTTVFGSLLCLTAMVTASPIGSPIDEVGSPLQAAQKRNILVPGYLIPTKMIDAAAVAGTPATAWPYRVPTSAVDLAKRAIVTMPNLVPTSQVDLATDTLGTQIVSPLFVPTVVADVGTTTSGCVVSISSYSVRDQ